MPTTRHLVAAAAGASVVLTGAPAASADAPSTKLVHRYQHAYAKAQRHGEQPGRNILLQGVVAGKSVRVARAGEVRESAAVLQRMTAPAPAASTASGTAPSAALQAIAQCESGGDPTAVDASGTYYGKYQFDVGTWAANGGTGNPAAASEAEQDAIAAKLYAARGAQPWPVCGQ